MFTYELLNPLLTL